MKLRSLLFIALSLVVVLSCGKDDGPTSPPAENNAPDYGENKSVTVSAGISDTHIIGTYTATDADEDDELTYSISTNSNGIFKINATTGQLSLASGKTLDPEDSPYTITLTVSDGTATDSMELTITATAVDPDNTAPTITANQVFAKPENSLGDIGQVEAGDDDEEDSLTYILNTDTEFFVIDANSGIISLAEGVTLDYEDPESQQFLLSVTVSDGRGGMATENVTVNTTDVNEAPVFGQAEYTFEAAEDIAEEVEIGEIAASDPEADALEYTIKEDESGLFEIDAATGALSLGVGQNLDFEKAESYSLKVTVTETGTEDAFAVDMDVTVTVTNVIDSPLYLEKSSFILTWDGPANFEMVISNSGSVENGEYLIEWGDGSPMEIKNGEKNPSHLYQANGPFTIAINGAFNSIQMVDNPGAVYLASIDQWGETAWQDLSHAFDTCEGVENNAVDAPNLSQVTDLSFMFKDTESFDGNLNHWDVSGIQNMQGMFNGSSFNGSIGEWDVSNVENMSWMFGYNVNFNQDIGDWEVYNVESMHSMFAAAYDFNQDISGWEVKNVTSMEAMFIFADQFNQDLSNWNVAKVENMRHMFYQAENFDQDLGSWNISSADKMNKMLSFSGLSPGNYNATLGGWASQNVQTGVTLGVANLYYCGPQAQGAVNALTLKNWQFIDHTYLVNCP